MKKINASQPTTEFLANEIYLPGYMAIRKEDYDLRGGLFSFDVKEPPVARGDIVHYFTPRGLHICVSQAGYALVEHVAREGLFEGVGVEELRQTLLAGRVKIVELYQKFRREVGLNRVIQGRFDISKFRTGKLSALKLDFAFENGAISGNFLSMISPESVAQTNADIARI